MSILWKEVMSRLWKEEGVSLYQLQQGSGFSVMFKETVSLRSNKGPVRE